MTVEQKQSVIDPMIEKHFPEAFAQGREPSASEMKERIVLLDSTGEKQQAAELLEWREQKKKTKSKLAKVSTFVMFSLAVAAAILGVLWFIFGFSSSSSTLVVCSKAGQILEGEQCFSTPAQQQQQQKTDDATNDGQVLIGQS